MQEPQEAAYAAMPQNAMLDVPVDFCLPTDEMAAKLNISSQVVVTSRHDEKRSSWLWKMTGCLFPNWKNNYHN